MNIDVHWHHIPASWIKSVIAGDIEVAGTLDTSGPEPVVELYGRRVKLSEAASNIDAALAAMDAAGLDLATPSIVPPLRQYEADSSAGIVSCRAMNEGFAEVAELSAGRLRPLANVPLQHPSAATEELRRCVLELGLPGVAVGTNVNGRNLGEEDFRPFWRAVAELDTFVFVHPEVPMGGEDRLCSSMLRNFVGFPVDTAVAVASMIFDGVYEDVGPLKTCYAHGGGAFPYIFGRWEHGYQNRLAETAGHRSPREYLESLYCDTLVHSPESLRFLVNLVGADHVMLASDYPFNMGDSDPVRTMEAAIEDPEAREMIASGTASKLLRI